MLVGDSGEKDPEIYGKIARKFAGRIERILIRNVGATPGRQSRYRKAFRGLADSTWSVFNDPWELPEWENELP